MYQRQEFYNAVAQELIKEWISRPYQDFRLWRTTHWPWTEVRPYASSIRSSGWAAQRWRKQLYACLSLVCSRRTAFKILMEAGVASRLKSSKGSPEIISEETFINLLELQHQADDSMPTDIMDTVGKMMILMKMTQCCFKVARLTAATIFLWSTLWPMAVWLALLWDKENRRGTTNAETRIEEVELEATKPIIYACNLWKDGRVWHRYSMQSCRCWKARSSHWRISRVHRMQWLTSSIL